MARIKKSTWGEALEVARKATEATIYTDEAGFYIVEVIIKKGGDEV